MPSKDSPPPRSGDVAPSRYPGERLGFPDEGRGAIARPGRRMIALAIDWGLAILVGLPVFHNSAWPNLAIFMLMQVIFIPTIGGSIGHRIMGLRLVALKGGWIGLWRPIVRTVLLALVLPALIWDSDQRGFHDKVAGTVLLRL